MKLKTVVGLLFGTYMSVSAVTVAPVVTERTFTPTPSDIYDLDHYKYYTWNFLDAIPAGANITSATLSFDDISNWKKEENKLWMWLLDGKIAGGSTVNAITTYGDSQPDIQDAFAQPDWSSIAKTHIADYVDSNDTRYKIKYEDKNYAFDSNLLEQLEKYVSNDGFFALGFDPDCHYNNSGVSFKVTWETSQTPPSVPEAGATLWLLAGGLGALPMMRRFLRR